MKNNNILEEVVRVREIMGLPSIIVEQGTRGKESNDVTGNVREKECPCNDGSSHRYCCTDYVDSDGESGYGPDWTDSFTETKQYDSPLFDQYTSFGIKPTKDMYLKELQTQVKQYLAKSKKEEAEWKSLSEEEKKKRSKNYCLKQFKKDKDYASYETCDLNYRYNTKYAKTNQYLPNIINNMEKHLGMSEEEFAGLKPEIRSQFARTQEERVQATKDYNVFKQKGDLEYANRAKRSRDDLTTKKDEAYVKSTKYTNKLVKAFKKKLDKQSLRRWDNKDKDYNEKGWVMSEEDKKELFTLFKDYFIKWKEINPKWVKKYKNKDIKLLKEFFSKINLKNVKGPDEVIPLEPIETEETEPITSCSVDYGMQFFGVAKSDFIPFINNRAEIHQDLKDKVNEMVTELGKFLENNPGSTMEIESYKIWTSASRARNGGQALNWSFAKLSQERAKSVKAYVDAAFQEIGITLPQPTIDAGGYNKDGSSGPNPPKPFSMVLTNSDNKKDRNEENRNEFGTPLACKPDSDGRFNCPNYDKYKYCMMSLPIVINVPIEEVDEIPGEPGTEEKDRKVIETRKWEIAFIPRKSRERQKVPKLRWNKMKFNYKYFNKKPKGNLVTNACAIFTGKKGMGTGRKIVGIAGGPLIDDVVNNNMASYNVQ